jgi:flagellar motility protein MotE (MotC chaperone)
MDPKRQKALFGLLIFGYLAFFAANYAYLKTTIKWPEAPVDTTAAPEQPETLDELHLTWDITGKEGPPKEISEQEKQAKERQRIRGEAVSIADSVATETALPIQGEISQTQQKLETTQDQVKELERLLTMLATQADSVDQEHARRLSKIVEMMKPADAAAVLNRLNNRTNAELLLSMKQRQAAKILAAMPKDRAAEVARYLSRAYARSSIL